MNLFSSKKNIFLKIMNGILLLWFVGALAICANNFITMLMPEPFLTYEEFKAERCGFFKEHTEEDSEEPCQSQYNNYKTTRKRDNYYNRRGLLVALSNVIIVGSTIYTLNRKKEE
ncbi:MAG: hypothetical protein ACOXZS_03965 [Bacilli bacterium]|jgi:hypothetical protein